MTAKPNLIPLREALILARAKEIFWRWEAIRRGAAHQAWEEQGEANHAAALREARSQLADQCLLPR